MFHLKTLENVGWSILDSQIRGVEGRESVVIWGAQAGKEHVLCAYYVLSAWLSHLVPRTGWGWWWWTERDVTVSSFYTRGTKR